MEPADLATVIQAGISTNKTLNTTQEKQVEELAKDPEF
jgi:hypothetical protein